MFANLRFVMRCMHRRPPLTYNALKTLTAAISNTSVMFKSTNDDLPQLPQSPVVDIDVEKMMYEDEELGSLFRMPNEEDDDDDEEGAQGAATGSVTSTTTTLDQNGIPLAPVDIDPWVEEEEVKQGTVEVENFEKPPIEYPPIPKDRSGTYQFKGIKIKLPQSMLKDATYRYRLDPEDQEQLADDIRICKFEK